MTTDFQFYAPTGAEIRGTYEQVPGAASVAFHSADRDFTHSGQGTEMFWDATLTQKIGDVALFSDTNGKDWLQHHLIPDGTPLSPATIKIIRHELLVGEAMEAAIALHQALSAIPLEDLVTIKWNRQLDGIRGAYYVAKSNSVQAISRELEARSAE